MTQPPPGLVVSDHTGPLNPPSPLSSHSWPERGEKAGPPYYLWVWIRLFIAYTHHCRTLHTAPRTWATRNSCSREPGKSQGIRWRDMVFQTQPPSWTYGPRLKCGKGGGGATESNRWTLYRTPSLVMCRLFVCLSFSLLWRFIHF